ncbi:cyclin-dependent kinase inhibitor 4-like isoform X2 [Gastrolobium bilobum]|uniref:cyclin-dependent kinase inhibitor 4-like isoform X2 n=1 Tax=Gastrolobium bilobum TaxID=150636 RepID=UPI002AB1FA5A|nr:cyclin-dependent kinase inhibitor 4-like isoform X2 [Gastrolobium bilobum]
MGKYMKKAKPKGEMALVDSTTTTTYFGVRTRAKTLALQKSQPQLELSPTSGSYLQLRNRRLHKPPISHDSSKRPRHQNPKSSIPSPASGSRLGLNDKDKEERIVNENVDGDGAEEACFGENVLDFEGRERSTRESTPCSLIRDPDTIRTPGSTTRPTCSTEAYRRTEHATRRQIPTAREMDEFFAGVEEAQQRQFIEKYNFDPVNEKPLPGRYEWEKLKS